MLWNNFRLNVTPSILIDSTRVSGSDSDLLLLGLTISVDLARDLTAGNCYCMPSCCQKMSSSTTSLSFDVPSPRNSSEYPHILYISRKQNARPTFCCWQYVSDVSIFIQFFSAGLRKTIFSKSAFPPFKVIQGHWFWYQSKAHISIWLPISPS